MPVAGPRFAGELVAIDAGGRVTFKLVRPQDGRAAAAGSAEPRSLTAGELVRWGHPLDPRPQALLLLNDRTRIVAAAAWAGGAPVALAGDELVVKSDLLEESRLPRQHVRGIVLAERSRLNERRRLEALVRADAAAARAEDEVLLTNDDRLKGRITEITGSTLTLSTEAGDARLPLSRVRAAIFAIPQVAKPATTAARTAPASASTVVALRDGSLLHAESVRANEKELDVRLSIADLKFSGGAASDIVALQSLRSDRFAYLSDLEPTDSRHVPYLSIEWPHRRDLNVLGGPLSVAGNRYFKGVGMHSAGRLTYRLDGNWRRFEADVAIDDSAQRRGSVTFGVHLLRSGQWQAAYSSGIVRGGDAPKPASIDVSGAQGLTLTVDYADRGDELDHADWIDARLVR